MLGEYCGVVKTLAQSELDAAAACAPDEHLTGFIIKDKTETFDTDIELPGAHRARRERIQGMFVAYRWSRMVPPEPDIQMRMTFGAKTEIQRPVCRTSHYVQINGDQNGREPITCRWQEFFEVVGLFLTGGCHKSRP